MMQAAELRSLRDSEVLGHLLHSLCQPLTTLHCSLELALDEFTERQCETVSVALEQADRAIETVRLMREYLDLRQGQRPVQAVALAPAVHAVLGQLSVVAEAHKVPLLASGRSAAVLAINEFWLQRALRYLVGTWLDDPPIGSAVAVLLEDRASGSLVSMYRLPCRGLAHRQSEVRVASRLREARLAIATRVFESAGASVELFCGGTPGFIVRIPRTEAVAHQLSA
jgi:hypothetical protein